MTKYSLHIATSKVVSSFKFYPWKQGNFHRSNILSFAEYTENTKASSARKIPKTKRRYEKYL